MISQIYQNIYMLPRELREIIWDYKWMHLRHYHKHVLIPQLTSAVNTRISEFQYDNDIKTYIDWYDHPSIIEYNLRKFLAGKKYICKMLERTEHYYDSHYYYIISHIKELPNGFYMVSSTDYEEDDTLTDPDEDEIIEFNTKINDKYAEKDSIRRSENSYSRIIMTIDEYIDYILNFRLTVPSLYKNHIKKSKSPRVHKRKGKIYPRKKRKDKLHPRKSHR